MALDATLAEAHHGLGLALHEQGLLDEAENSYREAIRIDPTFTPPWVALARLQAERGDRDESCQTARRVLAIRPKVADAYWRLAMNLKGALPDCDIEAMQGLLEHKYVSHSLRAGLHFALGAVFNGASSHAGRRALRCRQRFADGPLGRERPVIRPRQVFSHDRPSDRCVQPRPACPRPRLGRSRVPAPVFVVGLPAASGTTLVEQILASHSQVHGAGELHDAIRLFSALPGLVGQLSGDPFEALWALGPNSAVAVARKYLAKLDRSARPRRGEVGQNARQLQSSGTDCPLTARARVILCSRDLRDVALSCWQTSFATNPWTNNWEHIARRFADHERMLAHWKQTKPIDWLDVVYGKTRLRPGGPCPGSDRLAGPGVGAGLLGVPQDVPGRSDGQPTPGAPADPYPLGRTVAKVRVDVSTFLRGLETLWGRWGMKGSRIATPRVHRSGRLTSSAWRR